MVYFKLTKELVEIIKDSRLENLVGCQKYCDRQYISFKDIEAVLQKLKKDMKDAQEKLQKKIAAESKKKGNKEITAEDLMNNKFDVLDFISRDKITETKEELEEVIVSLRKYESMEIRQITEKTEILFIDEHICNDNLKIRYVDEAFMEPEELIEENEKSLVTLKDCEKKFAEDPDVKQAREQSNEVMLEQIKLRIEKKQYREMTKGLRGGDAQEQELENQEKQEFRFTLAFGFGFISLMFLSFICGYFLGLHIFGLSMTNSLIMSLVFGISTIILETILFLIRLDKMDRQKKRIVKED
ncbi:UNKNOWN [Stylonychia lemnae]|uniref:Uncharacterized protein n=1 Tax=Stylonychia lemnae TaxID=5949 RepID=A0A078B0K2_STYLE|nr:UNKNOWN [Stylonychia lemnae]|eukprot:CDW88185.1 UNKNOWN [Stylonychia lemnae]